MVKGLAWTWAMAAVSLAASGNTRVPELHVRLKELAAAAIAAAAAVRAERAAAGRVLSSVAVTGLHADCTSLWMETDVCVNIPVKTVVESLRLSLARWERAAGPLAPLIAAVACAADAAQALNRLLDAAEKMMRAAFVAAQRASDGGDSTGGTEVVGDETLILFKKWFHCNPRREESRITPTATRAVVGDSSRFKSETLAAHSQKSVPTKASSTNSSVETTSLMLAECHALKTAGPAKLITTDASSLNSTDLGATSQDAPPALMSPHSHDAFSSSEFISTSVGKCISSDLEVQCRKIPLAAPKTSHDTQQSTETLRRPPRAAPILKLSKQVTSDAVVDWSTRAIRGASSASNWVSEQVWRARHYNRTSGPNRGNNRRDQCQQEQRRDEVQVAKRAEKPAAQAFTEPMREHLRGLSWSEDVARWRREVEMLNTDRG